MNAVDTNLLVYAHRRDVPWHDAAATTLRALAEGTDPWAIPWPCVHEFFSVTTNPRVFSRPSTGKEAVAQLDSWRASPSIVLLGETDAYWSELRTLVADGHIIGPRIHDARIAALCLTHGVRELLTADRDFTRFPTLRVRNPLVARPA